MTVEQLITKIQTMDQAIIAIDGPSGSGKSTLALRLQQDLDITLFHTDDYFLPPQRKTQERLAQPGGNLDVERMTLEVFSHLQDERIVSNHFNCTTNLLEYREPVARKKIVVIEGVYAMLPVFQPFYNLMIYLDVEPEIQEKRIVKRSNEMMLQRYKTEWIPLEQAYFDAFDIRNHADYVIVI